MTLDDGRVVNPSDFLGPSIPGRKVNQFFVSSFPIELNFESAVLLRKSEIEILAW